MFAEAQPKPTHAEREQQRRGAAQKHVADAAAVVPQKGLPFSTKYFVRKRINFVAAKKPRTSGTLDGWLKRDDSKK